MESSALVLLLVELLFAVVVGEAVATVAASEMVAVLVVLQGGDTSIRISYQNYPKLLKVVTITECVAHSRSMEGHPCPVAPPYGLNWSCCCC